METTIFYCTLIQELKVIIEKYLDINIKEAVNLDYYKNYFFFTFQEFEIFKKQVNRYKALYKKEFLYFFDKV